MSDQPSSRVAGPDDIAVVSRTVALAFFDDPVWGPAMGGAGTTLEQKEGLWRIFIAGAVRYPWSRIVNGGAAVSVWFPPDSSELDDDQEVELQIALTGLLGPVGAAEFAELAGRFEANHKHDVPHAYLSLLATHPDHRGRGIGQRLLADDLARFDAEGLAAYLESTNPGNDHRSERLGFRRVGGFQAILDDAPVSTMWRPAGGS